MGPIVISADTQVYTVFPESLTLKSQRINFASGYVRSFPGYISVNPFGGPSGQSKRDQIEF
jgi:hypothetical protein